MNSTIRIRVLLIYLCLSCGINAFSQPEITIFTDVGSTNVTQEYFLKSATIGQYGFGKNQIEAGFLFNIKTMNENTFAGYRLQASHELLIKNLSFSLQGFWIQTTYSDLLRETNWGVQIRIPTKHFETIFGTEFRTYAFREDAIQTYGIEEDAAKMNETLISFTHSPTT